MHLITALCPFDERICYLNASFFQKTHYLTDRNNLTALVYRFKLESQPRPHTTSFVHLSMKRNPYLKDRRLTRMPLVLLPPLLPQFPEPPVGKPKPLCRIPIKLRDAWTVEALTRMRDKSRSHVARILTASVHPHPIITSRDRLPRP